MRSSFDTDKILFSLLSGSPVKAALSGGIYYDGGRPDDSNREDIVIGTVTVTQESYPQEGVSYVNVYVPDKDERIDGRQQMKANRSRLEALSGMVTDILMNARIDGVGLAVENQTVLQDAAIGQHRLVIRIRFILE